MAGQAYKRKLTVISCTLLSTFQKRDGGEGTIYEIVAVNEQGEGIELPLRSFSELPTGKLIEVDVSTHDHETYGRSYTLKLPRGSTMGHITPRVDELERQVARLQAQVAQLLEHAGLAAPPPATPADPVPADVPPPEPQPSF